jgi:two-component system cell cycle sensor histidine kinase/response regulator CckA
LTTRVPGRPFDTVDNDCERRRKALSAGRHERHTVLLVEDEATVRGLVQELLARRGYAVLTADDPTEALAVATRYPGPIHVLVTDLVMPGMHGRELATRLLAARPELRVLYMSGYVDDAFTEGELDGPATQFLAKPFTPEQLAANVGKLLEDS